MTTAPEDRTPERLRACVADYRFCDNWGLNPCVTPCAGCLAEADAFIAEVGATAAWAEIDEWRSR